MEGTAYIPLHVKVLGLLCGILDVIVVLVKRIKILFRVFTVVLVQYVQWHNAVLIRSNVCSVTADRYVTTSAYLSNICKPDKTVNLLPK